MLLYCVVYLHTGIDKLVDVKNALKRVNNWLSLGLQLGLLYTTLDSSESIEIDNRGKVEFQCMTKMLAAWLTTTRQCAPVWYGQLSLLWSSTADSS